MREGYQKETWGGYSEEGGVEENKCLIFWEGYGEEILDTLRSKYLEQDTCTSCEQRKLLKKNLIRGKLCPAVHGGLVKLEQGRASENWTQGTRWVQTKHIWPDKRKFQPMFF